VDKWVLLCCIVSCLAHVFVMDGFYLNSLKNLSIRKTIMSGDAGNILCHTCVNNQFLLKKFKMFINNSKRVKIFWKCCSVKKIII